MGLQFSGLYCLPRINLKLIVTKYYGQNFQIPSNVENFEKREKQFEIKFAPPLWLIKIL